MAEIKRARRVGLDDEIYYRDLGTRKQCAGQTANLPRLEASHWALMPFDTRLVWLTSWADGCMMLREAQRGEGWANKATEDFAETLGRVTVDADGGDGGAYSIVTAHIFNTSGPVAKLEAINMAIDTYFSSARLLGHSREMSGMGQGGRGFLERQHSRAADFLDAIILWPEKPT